MPPFRITVTEAEIRSLYPRWENNATLSKTQGNMTPDFVTAMLLEMFCK